METINVGIKTNSRNYPIFIGNSILKNLQGFVGKKHNKKRIAVITDYNVNKLYGQKLKNTLRGFNTLFISIQAGESSKSRYMKERIEDKLLDNKFGRDSLIIAIGGGVIGDLAGFVASTFNRGVPIIHVPTTMLAMVDSSIGGKTSVNTKHGKNLIGATYQPTAVFADMDFLQTLSGEEFKNGLAEVIKIAIIKDKKLFESLDKNHEKIVARDKTILQDIIKRNIKLKLEVIEEDAEEKGLRQILNFGHTFGHALEAYYKYKIKHGYAVSQGMLVESKISAAVNNLSENDEERIRNLINLFGFPLTVNLDVDTSKIIELMESDKKSVSNNPRFVLIDEIGTVKSKDNIFSFEVETEVIKQAIEECKND